MAKTKSKPVFILVSGANGSGKTTLAKSLVNSITYINPDFIKAKEKLSDLETGKRVVFEVNKRLEEKKENFALETTLAGMRPFKLVKKAKFEGWNILLIFIGLSDVNLHIDRVRHRVQRGEHNIPEQIIRRRYKRSYENVIKVAQEVDVTFVFDNTDKLARLIGLIMHGKIIRKRNNLPGWAEKILEPFE